MAGFDRGKFKATSMTTLKSQQEELDKVRPSGNKGDILFHEISEGKDGNLFRIAPFHPDGGGSSYAEAKCVSYLNVTKPKRDDKFKIIEGEFEIKRSPIFNSKVHGGTKQDAVEVYMNFAKEIAIPEYAGGSTDKFNIIWEHIVGNFQKKLQGIKPMDSTVMYAWKKQKDGSWSKPGRLEVTKSVKNQLIDLALEFSSGDEATPDPFSDPDQGICVNIHNSGTGFDRYTVTLESKQQGLTKTFIPTPLTDEQLEEFMKLDSLYKLYVNSYKRSDFDAQMEGLKRFDEELAKKGYPIQVFGYDAFLDTLAEIESQLPEVQEKEEEQKEQVQDEAPFTPDPPKKQVVKPTPAKVDMKTETKPVESASTQDRLAAIRSKYKK
jgi:hypothetical protein